MNMLKRIIFGAVGIAAVQALWFALMDWTSFFNLMSWSSISYMLLVIGGLNWGVVAITGNVKKDLLSFINIK